MLIRRDLPNGMSNHGEIAKPLIFKGLTGKYRECAQRLNYRPLHTIYTDSQSVTRSVLVNTYRFNFFNSHVTLSISNCTRDCRCMRARM